MLAILRAEKPDVTRFCDRRPIQATGGRDVIGVRVTLCLVGDFEKKVNFSRLETSDFKIETNLDEVLQFDSEHLLVPAGFQRQLIIRQDVGAAVDIAEVVDPDDGDSS